MFNVVSLLLIFNFISLFIYIILHISYSIVQYDTMNDCLAILYNILQYIVTIYCIAYCGFEYCNTIYCAEAPNNVLTIYCSEGL